jgi:hypothetical protein
MPSPTRTANPARQIGIYPPGLRPVDEPAGTPSLGINLPPLEFGYAWCTLPWRDQDSSGGSRLSHTSATVPPGTPERRRTRPPIFRTN